MELNIQQIEINSRFINDIVEVRRLRAILFFELSTSVAFFYFHSTQLIYI